MPQLFSACSLTYRIVRKLVQVYVQRLVCMTVAPNSLDTCGKLPGTLTLLAVLSCSLLTRNHTIPFIYATHVRLCTWPFPLVHCANKVGGAWDRGRICNLVSGASLLIPKL